MSYGDNFAEKLVNSFELIFYFKQKLVSNNPSQTKATYMLLGFFVLFT